MNSSGIRRGLAVSAVSALAFAGLALSPANAQTIDDALDAGDHTVLYVPNGNWTVSKKADGQNTTFTLLAGAPKAVVGTTVNAIHFSSTGATPNLNVVIPVTAGVAEYQWDVPAQNGIVVTAQAVDAANNPIGTSDSWTISAANAATNDSVSVDGSLREKKGYYTLGGSNFVSVTGQQNGGTGTAYALNPVNGVFGGGTGITASGPVVGGINPWGAVVDVPPAYINADAADDDVPIAVLGNQDEDGNVFSLYKQTVAGADVKAPVAPGYSSNVSGDLNGADPSQPSGGAPDGIVGNDITQYLITVKDQFGKPVAGVPTYESDPAGVPEDHTLRNANNGAINGATAVSTDWTGTRRVTLSETLMDSGGANGDQNPAAGVQSTYIVVDLNGDHVYQNSGDVLLQISQTNIPAAPASITLVNKLPATAPSVANATAQDDDECGDVVVTVKDADGNPVQNATPTITVTKTTNGVTTVTHPAVTGPTNPAGQTHVAGCLQGANNDKTSIKVEATTINGTAATPLVVESDEADVVWDEGTTDQAKNGTSVTEGAKLKLPSGSGLPGRTVGLTYGPTDNSSFAPQAAQPAGIVTGTPTTATATTAAGGAFSIVVTDPATPNGEELNNTITATAPALSSGGDVINSVLDLDFLRSLTPTSVKIYNDPSASSQADGLSYLLDGENGLAPFGTDDRPSPGGLGLGTVAAFNSDGVLLDDVDIPLTITEGNFVNQADPFDPAPAVGNMAGEWKSAGKTQTISTNDGVGLFVVNIERNAGFDDDGLVADKIHAAVGSATAEHDFDWSTRTEPLNQGSFSVTLSDSQDSSILPKARAGEGDSAQQVYYDVVTTDQFGNRTQQDIDVTDNSPVADFFFPNGDSSQFDLSNPAIVAYSEDAANQSLEVELPAATSYKYTDDPTDGSFSITSLPALFAYTTFSASEQQKNTDAINWYTVDLDDPSLYTLTQEGAENVPVGSTVSYTLTATDPEGQPLNGIGVGFLRVGPGDEGQDDDGQQTDITNENGEAFYDFAGSVPGIASVSAVVYDDMGPFDYHRLFVVGPDTVTFDNGPKEAIDATLSGKNNGAKDDKLTVEAPAAAKDAVVKLFKYVKGDRRLVDTKSLSDAGLAKFTVTDKNGKAKTKYVAKVKSTAVTKSAETNTKSVK